jgi:hypothetical protein
MAKQKNNLVGKQDSGLVRTERGRGRPARVRPSEIKGRADNYRWILESVWGQFWPPLSEAQSTEAVVEALRYARPYDREFESQASLILSVLREQNFPTRRKARINFLADSLAAVGIVSPRRSRDICAAERSREKKSHHIIRFEFYVECSCGYKGPSKDYACQECGARILFPLGLSGLV